MAEHITDILWDGAAAKTVMTHSRRGRRWAGGLAGGDNEASSAYPGVRRMDGHSGAYFAYGGLWVGGVVGVMISKKAGWRRWLAWMPMCSSRRKALFSCDLKRLSWKFWECGEDEYVTEQMTWGTNRWNLVSEEGWRAGKDGGWGCASGGWGTAAMWVSNATRMWNFRNSGI